MSAVVAVAQFACDTAGGGTQDFTTADLGGLTPSAALFLFSRAATLDSASDGALLGFGYTDGTKQYAHAISSEHNVDTTDTYKRAESDEVISFLDPADGSVEGEADFNSFIANGVRVNWGDYPPSAYYVTVMFFAGTDVSEHCDVFTVPAIVDNSVDVTAPDFEPDVVIVGCLDSLIPIASASHANLSLGVAVNDGADTQATLNLYSTDNAGTSALLTVLYDHYAAARLNSRAVEIGTFDAAGFSATARLGAAGGKKCSYLALAFNGAISFGLDVVDTPVAGGNHGFTVGLGGDTPQAALIAMSALTAVDTLTGDSTAGTMGAYAVDADDEGSHAYQDEDNQDTSDTQSYAAAKAVLDSDAGAGLFDASFVSFAANTITLNFTTTDGTARKWWILSFGVAAGGTTVALDAVASAQSSTPDDVALAVHRPMAATAQANTATPDVATLAVLRGMVASALAQTSTPDDVVLSIGEIVTFAAACLAQTSTPDAVPLAVQRTMAAAAQAQTTTPDTITLAIQRLFAAVATAQTTTPDTVALERIVGMVATALAQTTTPDTVALERIVGMVATALAQTTTPDTVALERIVGMVATALAQTTTSDTATLAVERLFAALAHAQTTTPDDVVLSIAGLVMFAAAALAQTSTPDAVTLAVERLMSVTAHAQTTTPDTVALERIVGYLATAAAATSTPDTVALERIVGMLAAATAQTSTPDMVTLAVHRLFAAVAAAQTSTPDDVVLMVRVIIGLVTVSLSGKAPGAAMAGSSPVTVVTGGTPQVSFDGRKN